MDLNKLYYFYITAKHQHVTRAAAELQIAQPALTKSIKLLEQDLGVPLFYKQGRSIRLTGFGKHLLTRLESVFPIVDRLPEELRQMKKRAVDSITIHAQAASLLVTEAIVAYKALHPHVAFQMAQNENAPNCDISVSIATMHITPGSIRRYSIREDIFLAVPRSGQYGQLESIRLEDVKSAWFICPSAARPLRRICDELCLQGGFRPNILFESDSPEAVRNLISAGAGIGFWPAFCFGKISKDVALLPILDIPAQRTLQLCLHDNGLPRKTAEDFFVFLTSYMEEKKAAAQTQ